MNTALSPLVSEFETEEQQVGYTAWLNDKVRRSLSDARPSIPHDQVMVGALDLLNSKKTDRAAD